MAFDCRVVLTAALGEDGVTAPTGATGGRVVSGAVPGFSVLFEQREDEPELQIRLEASGQYVRLLAVGGHGGTLPVPLGRTNERSRAAGPELQLGRHETVEALVF